jgi:hypothetical protein
MCSHRICYVTLPLVFATTLCCVTCPAQEVGSVDLTTVAARTDLRRPGGTPPEGASVTGTGSTMACFASTRQAVALRISLVSLDRTHYQVGDEPTFEVTVENVGSEPLRIPFSPHLADLQPEDSAKKFAYSELQLVLWVAAGEVWSASTGGGISLYGAEDHADTMVTLRPAESVRIIGKGKLALPDQGPTVGLIHAGHVVDRVYARVSLYHVETLLTATAEATVRREVCPGQTQGQGVPIVLSVPKQ